MTELPLKAAVTCTDGPAGTSSAVIIDPVKKTLTHLVVKLANYDERLVPVEHVSQADHESIALDLSKKELAAMPSFTETQYIEGVPYYPECQGSEWEAPYVTMDYGPEAVVVEKVPPGELSIHRGDPVKATNGQVGHVGEFIIDPTDGHITHLVLQKGHLWGKREITVPLALIASVEEGVVHLTIDKHALSDLPSVKVNRHYRSHQAE